MYFHSRKCTWKCRLEKAAILPRPQYVWNCWHVMGKYSTFISSPITLWGRCPHVCKPSSPLITLWPRRKCRHFVDNIFMMTLSNGNFLRVAGYLCLEFTGYRWIPHTTAIDVELWCFFYLRLIERLRKQSWGWWFLTPSRPLRRHSNV